MKATTLISLLPLLATISAHPHPHAQPANPSSAAQIKEPTRVSRKSIAFGPELKHSTFSAFHQVEPAQFKAADEIVAIVRGDPSPVIKHLMSTIKGIKGEGEGYFIRDDSYTDSKTGITHVYIKQLVNGLEVVNGDINMNIDRDGRVLSWGNSFYQGPHPTHSSEQDGFIDSLIAAQPRLTGQCIQLTSLISTTFNARTLLFSRLNELKQDSQVGGVVKSVLSMLGEILGLPSSSGGKSLDKGQREQVLSALKKDYGFDSIEELERQLERLDGQMERLEDHLGVICAPPSSSSSSSEGLKGDKGIEESLIPGLVGLLDHLVFPGTSFDRSKLLDSLVVHPANEFVPSVQAPSEPHAQLISGASIAGVEGDVQARLVYTQTDEKGLRLSWKYVLRMRENWYDATVDWEDGQVLGVVDWASSVDPLKVKKNKGGKQKPLPVPKPATKPYSYSVFPFGVNDPAVGNISTEIAPWDTISSPAGWHAFPDSSNPWIRQTVKGMKSGQKGPFVSGNYSTSALDEGKQSWSTFGTTMGNNVFAQEDFEGANNWLHNERPVNSSYIFDYEYGEPDGLRPKEYIDLAVTQLFYTSNMYHDLLYRLGFDEASGNFQMYNFGKGGLGGDGVICQAQDGSGTNNANFMTPPDGTQPRMRMYVWDTATPYRDGDLEAGIVIHEYTHGLSTRLTGGPANSGCLGYGEAGGMGEGWGDAFATLIRQIEEYGHHEEEYGMGAWAANRKTGIRNYVYSTNMSSNPSSFKTLDKPGYWGVHAIGEVWAEMLFVVNERLIEAHGFSHTLFPPITPEAPSNTSYYLPPRKLSSSGKPSAPLVPRHGNTLLAHLIVQGMKLQPCRPSFTDARDAIIQSDLVLTGGENACLIWKAFAERGLGPDAKTLGQLPWGGGVRSEDYSIPKVCGKGGKKVQ